MKLGIDIGSTTVKLVLMDENDNVLFRRYERHFSDVFEKVRVLLNELLNEKGNIQVYPTITGSGGLSLAEHLSIPFEQEVICCSKAVEVLIPETDVAIELGGEDAKITFYGSTIEQRMNGTCAGGTGAFIDQMALLLNTNGQGLNEAAKGFNMIYPIAARCGVFAKTDIQPLINEGASLEDLSASIFQAVVNQTISGLACGYPIKGKIAFLGGPLNFLSQLRQRFISTLDIKKEDIIFPENAKFFVALGAAYLAKEKMSTSISLATLTEKIADNNLNLKGESLHLAPLFSDQEDYNKFMMRHGKDKIKRKNIKKAKGYTFLGIDAGSTTTKATLIDGEKNLLYSYYNSNKGDPIMVVKAILEEIYSLLPDSAYIGNCCVTGYGESLIKTAFRADMGEIETMAHYKGAEAFLHGVEFILDIGGQDMKCMKIKDGAIYSIMLNEACSSGCGSFLETYAKSVNLDTRTFASEALFAKNPVDLGTRCTVFMNSKVKQAQKEGATLGDISAGLSYSVIKNALYKVIKLRNPEEAGEKIVVQGGTFLNNAVLRSMERVIGKNVVRPDISGLMGAYGAALIALENHIPETESSILRKEEINTFSVKHSSGRCKICENKCILTINIFSDGSKFVTGNRCERGAGGIQSKERLPNLYKYKRKRLFDYMPLSDFDATRGTVAIPRVLNMYENYPFWFTFFTKLKFRVVLSPTSSKALYEKGIDTIASDTVCYPAKLVHGHIRWLVDAGEQWIFYPSINYERKEDITAPNHYNCPIVATYPELIANNMDEIFKENLVKFSHPFIPYDNDQKLTKQLFKLLKDFHITRDEVSRAVAHGRREQNRYKADVMKQGEYALKYARSHGKKSIVLSGRPYHVDPEINHGIDEIISSQDMVVLSEDSIAHKVDLTRPLRVLDQWVYHSRLYKAATFVGRTKDVELIQLNSFGCGLDAVTTDQVEEICNKNNKLYTLLKIDEGSNLGAAKIRIRSLKAAMDERTKKHIVSSPRSQRFDRVPFREDMAKTHTIIVPQMSPIHFTYFEAAMNSCGYKVKLLPPVDKNSVEEGLKYINNDACYPTIVTLGQIISALKSGEYDLKHTAIFMSQTGGGCRASNYVPLLRKALLDLDMGDIPVISFNVAGLEDNPGFNITVSMGFKMTVAAVYGDLIMNLLYATRPYEKVSGSAEALVEKWSDKIISNCIKFKLLDYKENIYSIVEDFKTLPKKNIKKPKIGVVGEILVKYHPNANNDIVNLIEKEGGEAVVLDLIDFFLYGMYSKKFNYENLSGSYFTYKSNAIAIKVIEWLRKPMREALEKSGYFRKPAHIEETAKMASEVISLGNQCGEGWLLTGEMIELMNHGVNNILCLQPFGCLPNHVTGKGVLKTLRKLHPKANITAIDYDPGASQVNQLNRIKLMMATAHKNN